MVKLFDNFEEMLIHEGTDDDQESDSDLIWLLCEDRNDLAL